ncbi:acetyl-CoA carboxylase biotin carboxylase subunit [Oceanibacterium hippocampi]|uniref:Biotin carboxylase n=1 Tax=Oceanibacterium hippocampi TaxID=745714 RepID=A0A1Y5TJY2_9PROT|nr:biotin carboxylase N-terminal domain-containing protein [Oceanibacterium hippocampi]SLN63708.1 Biotin carboxylase [Oceanibacterium hippocampi]
MKKVLVANRGEIACRIMRSCREAGIATVAVYSEADASALHVASADEAVLVGEAPAAKSYLDVDAILNAAARTGASAIHPGYGFLSENAAFAEAVEAAGLVWIGPAPETIRKMGDKERARWIAHAAGVAVLPASEPFDGGDMDALLGAAAGIGFPLLVKAANGGGGIGMRRVDDPAKLAAAVNATHGQAERLFGDGKVYLERFIRRARHVEVQVFGTGDGRAQAFWERDCSVQRRFQKVIEEAPAAGLSEARRVAMCEAAAALARAENYRGAGTVEFIVDDDSGDFYFLEMNTRIQVEHGVTEMILGIDLVARQLALAFGETSDALLESQAPNGVAIEARLYAERPEKGFLPQPGTLETLVLPTEMAGVRVDSGVRQGDAVSPYYDPMIAKVIAYGADRAAAIAKLEAALRATRIEGLSSNLGFLLNILGHADYRAGAVCTNFVETNLGELVRARVDA